MRYRHGCNGILVETYTHPTQGFHFEWSWVTLRNIQWHEGPISAPRRKTMLSYLVTNRPRHVTFALDVCSCDYALTKCRWLTPSLPTWTESVYRLLKSTPTVTIYYYYSAQKLVLILLSNREQKAAIVCIFLYVWEHISATLTPWCEILYDGRCGSRTGLSPLGVPQGPQNPKFWPRISRKREVVVLHIKWGITLARWELSKYI